MQASNQLNSTASLCKSTCRNRVYVGYWTIIVWSLPSLGEEGQCNPSACYSPFLLKSSPIQKSGGDWFQQLLYWGLKLLSPTSAKYSNHTKKLGIINSEVENFTTSARKQKNREHAIVSLVKGAFPWYAKCLHQTYRNRVKSKSTCARPWCPRTLQPLWFLPHEQHKGRYCIRRKWQEHKPKVMKFDQIWKFGCGHELPTETRSHPVGLWDLGHHAAGSPFRALYQCEVSKRLRHCTIMVRAWQHPGEERVLQVQGIWEAVE